MQTLSDTQNHIIRLPEVKKRTGLSRSTIYALIKENAFPSQIQLSKRAVGWHSHEVDNWVSSRTAAFLGAQANA